MDGALWTERGRGSLFLLIHLSGKFFLRNDMSVFQALCWSLETSRLAGQALPTEGLQSCRGCRAISPALGPHSAGHPGELEHRRHFLFLPQHMVFTLPSSVFSLSPEVRIRLDTQRSTSAWSPRSPWGPALLRFLPPHHGHHATQTPQVPLCPWSRIQGHWPAGL